MCVAAGSDFEWGQKQESGYLDADVYSTTFQALIYLHACLMDIVNNTTCLEV